MPREGFFTRAITRWNDSTHIPNPCARRRSGMTLRDHRCCTFCTHEFVSIGMNCLERLATWGPTCLCWRACLSFPISMRRSPIAQHSILATAQLARDHAQRRILAWHYWLRHAPSSCPIVGREVWGHPAGKHLDNFTPLIALSQSLMQRMLVLAGSPRQGIGNEIEM